MATATRGKISDFGRVVTGKTPPTKNPEYFGGDYPFITPSDMKGNTPHIVTERTISDLGCEKHKSIMLPSNSVCVTCIGATIGKMCITHRPSFTNQQINSIVVNTERHDYRYVYYVLNTEIENLKARAGGAATPIINKTAFSNIEIEIPPLLVQRKIASILSAYDDLIETNTRRIQILEEMAQRIYREWFVHFRYPGHEQDELVESELGLIPKGWKSSSLATLYDAKSGFAFKSSIMESDGDYGVIKIKNIQPHGVEIESIQWIKEKAVDDRAMKFLLSKKDVLIAMTGAQVGKVGIMPITRDQYFLNQRVGKFFLKPSLSLNHSFLYQVVRSADFQTNVVNIAQGAAQPNISGNDIGGIKIILPTMELIYEYEKCCGPIIDDILLLGYINRNLRQTRDLLLPKLISGKIDVSELDIIGDGNS